MSNYTNSQEMPLGLGMALAENLDAMNRFVAMSKTQQSAFIAGTHAIRSKQEMRQYVQRLLG